MSAAAAIGHPACQPSSASPRWRWSPRWSRTRTSRSTTRTDACVAGRADLRHETHSPWRTTTRRRRRRAVRDGERRGRARAQGHVRVVRRRAPRGWRAPRRASPPPPPTRAARARRRRVELRADADTILAGRDRGPRPVASPSRTRHRTRHPPSASTSGGGRADARRDGRECRADARRRRRVRPRRRALSRPRGAARARPRARVGPRRRGAPWRSPRGASRRAPRTRRSCARR